MKKLLLLSLLAAPALLCADELPGQLPNAGFEDGWGKCVPFVGKSGSDSNTNANTKDTGETPANWTISQVVGMSGAGATKVGEKLEPGNNSATAVKLFNSSNSIFASQIVPGYITLGTPWNTSVFGKKNDGGTFGGIQFALRPDALQFDYTRSHGTGNYANATEPFTVVAYTWTGQTTQKNVPASISMGSPAKITMYDRDRNILGIQSIYGDAPTFSDDFALVASINDTIFGDASAWTTLTLPFTYAGANTVPDKINVIFGAGRYFSATGIGNGNTLCVDNVKLLYYSRLSDIKVNGNSLAGFNPDKFEYYIEDASVMDTDGMVDFFNDFTGVKMGRACAVNMNGTGSTVKLTVTNPDGCDVDGLAKHVYSLSYGRFYDGLLDVKLNNENIVDGEAKSIFICKEREGYARFVLPDFAIALSPGDDPIPLGDIVVPSLQMLHVAADAKTYYRGSVQGMSFLGAIVADVNVEGYLSDAGEKNFKISVDWIMDPESGQTMPIPVRFYSEGVDPTIDPVVPSDLSGIADINAAPSLSAPIYYNLQGIRVDNPQPGQIYIQRLGNNASKILK